LKVVTCFDPAIRRTQKNDLFACATIGVNKAGTIFVRRAEGARIPFNDQVERVFAVYSADRPAQVGIETIAYQEALKQEVERRGKEQHLFIPVVELNPHTDKDMRIDAMAPLIENGTIRFRRDQQDAVRMFTQRPKAKHDDIPDVIEMAVSMVRKFVKAQAWALTITGKTSHGIKSVWETAPQRAVTGTGDRGQRATTAAPAPFQRVGLCDGNR